MAKDGTKFFRRMQGYDTTGIEWIGRYGKVTDVEPIAALKPDLIVTPSWPENIDQFQALAPAVRIEMFETPLETALFQFADLVNRTDRAKELKTKFEARAAELRTQIGDKLDKTTVSVITSAWEADAFFPANPTQAFGMVQQQMKLTRPESERHLGSKRVHLSLEVLGDHAADAMIVFTHPSDRTAYHQDEQQFLAHPLLSLLPQGKAGQIFAIDATQMIGSAWGKAMNGLEIFADILGDESLNRDLIME